MVPPLPRDESAESDGPGGRSTPSRRRRRMAGVLEGHPTLMLLGLMTALVAAIVLRATVKPFWHDEIYTIVIAGLPSIGDIWNAERAGLDLSPPLNAVATRLVHHLFRSGRVTTRMPAEIGFLVAAWAVFEIVRRRSTVVSASGGVLLLCSTAAFRYAYEARGYGLMLGCFGAALYSWSQAARGTNRRIHLPTLAVALAAGCWAQYSAVLAFLPIAAGECARWLQTRKADGPVWIALAAAASAIVPLPLLMGPGLQQAATFWAHAAGGDVWPTYRFLLEPLIAPWLPIAIAVVIGVERMRARMGGGGARIPGYEVVAGLVCLLLPAIGLLAALSSTGVFVPRYALNGTVAFAVAIPLLIASLSDREGLAPLVLAAVLSAGFVQSVVGSVGEARVPFVSPFARRPALAAAVGQPRPIVITGGLMFLQLWYYAPHTTRGRLWYIADPDLALRYTGTDTIDRGYQLLHRWTDINTQDYLTFVAANHDFVLYGAGSGWILTRLEEDGARMDGLGEELGARIMAVTVTK